MDPLKETGFIIAYRSFNFLGEKQEWTSNPDPQISKEIASLYSERNCRHCQSKGYLEFNNPACTVHNGMEYIKFCTCSIKALRKFAQGLVG